MKVNFYAYFREYANAKELTVDHCATVEELIILLGQRCGPRMHKELLNEGTVSDQVIILVNGRHIAHLGGPQARLQPDDEISIFPLVAGG
ncbi:MoaD/ThiS family protein [Heliobacterium chlorum]|uniref:MoaD/ThiS family protein n=1 Tax=Heliobacterium chlorum TaxID=2698 RepID=A0ABR7T399_HELCL|nr:ubiquitin-like small modifier protein 1 [Heliobacterium chlorum]MBC9784136.1 MoaD/ThiS family protein [Heliobacterium chlorum]